jgi:hypothetical protein
LPDVQVLAPGVSAAPLTYTVPGSQEILIKALSASFDGSGAAGAFVPAVRIIAPGGKLAGVFIANGQVSAGDSVYASWAPFLAGAGPNGIQFDVPNRGNWLAVTTSGAAPLSGAGVGVYTFGGGGVEVLSGDFLTLSSQQDGLVIESNDAAIPLQVRSAGGMTIQDTSTGILLLENTGGGEVNITTTGGGTQVYRSADGFVWFDNHGGGGENVYVFHLGANDNFVVRDSGGNLILAVKESGPEYHIKTGGAWVADL